MLSRLLIATINIALAASSVAFYVRDRDDRRPAQQFVNRFHVAQRRPEYADTIRYAPAADLTGEVAAEVALQDALGSVSLQDLDPDQRSLWIQNLGDLDSELDAARALLLSSLRQRPGWAYHRSLIGMIEYVRARRHMQLADSPDRWLRPLELAMRAAPNDPMLATFTAEAMIETWPHVESFDRQRVNPIFRAALGDPSFVSADYLDVLDLLGSNAVDLLPETVPSLRAALQAEIGVGDVSAAATLYRRWERAEWRSRESDLRDVVLRSSRGDIDGLRAACRNWTQKHPVFDWDTKAGRDQASLLLESWPGESGEWRSDARSDFIRFFLDRPNSADGKSVLRAASALSDTPRPIFARAALLAGDLDSAEAAAHSVEARGTFEWTRYYADLARVLAAVGRNQDALKALEAISPAARGECDVIVARKAISVGAGSPAGTDRPEGRSPHADSQALLWSGSNLPLCIDRSSTLILDLSADEPALVAYGFDSGRMATVFLQPGQTRIAVPLEDRTGRHIFSYRIIVGNSVTPVSAALQ